MGNLEATNYTQLGISAMKYLALPTNPGFLKRKVDEIEPETKSHFLNKTWHISYPLSRETVPKEDKRVRLTVRKCDV